MNATTINAAITAKGGLRRSIMEKSYTVTEVKQKQGKWWFRANFPGESANWYTASTETIRRMSLQALSDSYHPSLAID